MMMRLALSVFVLLGLSFGQSGPITFCAQDDAAAQEWIKRNKLEGKRWPVRRPENDASGCLDKLKPYEATTAPPLSALSDAYMAQGSLVVGAHFSCEKYDFNTGEVSGCKLTGDTSLDQAISLILKSEKERSDEVTRCGNWGEWIENQNGNVMYRRKNPPCPKNPAPVGTGNYSEDDLRKIGMDCIPEAARPRTLSNPVHSQWRKRCADKDAKRILIEPNIITPN